MTLILEKLRLLLWKFGQPLTKIPPSSNAAVSDLFIWRHTDEITTYFELLNLPYLLNFLGTYLSNFFSTSSTESPVANFVLFETL